MHTKSGLIAVLATKGTLSSGLFGSTTNHYAPAIKIIKKNHKGLDDLIKKGYKLQFRDRTSGPINAIFFDNINKTFQGGSSNFGEDYGIAW